MICPKCQSTKFGSPDFMVYNVTNNTFIIIDFYLDYILDLPEVNVESCTQIEGKIFGVAELRYDRTTVPGSSGRIAFKSEYLNDYLNREWEHLRI